ncbi:MAG: endonuclease MutS2 [Lachnospiraceae bacterium]|nr:endonuclease MutS2 [Lachnospiraceae bacterium]
MNEKTFEKLEYNKLRDKVTSFCVSDMGRNLMEQLKPSSNVGVVKNRLKETTEAREILDARGQVPIMGVQGVVSAMLQVEKGIVLEPAVLMELYEFLRGCRKMKHFMLENAFYGPTLAAYSSGMTELVHVEDEIFQAIKNNQVDSSASKTLKNIRQRKDEVENKIQEKLQRFLKHPANKTYLQDTYISEKNGHHTVPIKASYKNQVPGVVIEVSAKGSTVFVEPHTVAKLQGELANLQVEETMEVYQILAALTGSIHEHIHSIRVNMELIAQYDMIFAKGKYSRSIDGIAPKVNEHSYTHIVQGKHPLLVGEVIPLDFEIGKDYRSLIITGPNAGGKTLVLKTIGILTLAIMSGFHIEADVNSEISIFDKIFVDLGDDQSLENALSTFSSHMKNIADIMKNADKSTLLLFDEIGSGTEPNEGAGLAIAILEQFYQMGCITVATTHYGEIKHYGENHPDFVNAAMLFDHKTLTPLYKMVIGKSGVSNALWIAEKMQLPERVRIKAEKYMNHKAYNYQYLESKKVRQAKVVYRKATDKYQYQVGDRVKFAMSDQFGIVYREEDKHGNLLVFVDGEIKEFHNKRISLELPATELYPAGYDISTLFTAFSERKLEHDIKRGSKKALKKIQKEMHTRH